MENHVKLRLRDINIFKLSQFVRVGLLFLIVPILQLVRCDGPTAVCTKTSSCECEFSDGSGVISLVSIASKNGPPRFPYTKAPDGYFYAYNPCNSFTDAYCKNVAACQKSENGKEFFDVGDQASATFDAQGTSIVYTAMEGDTTRTSTVSLECDLTATTPVLEVKGEQGKDTGNYLFNLRSNCACKNGCIGGGNLSLGSVLCIIFSVGVILYLVIGILFLKFVRGAEGIELIPNFEFWKDFPILVKDGVLFLAGGCKSESNNYEQI